MSSYYPSFNYMGINSLTDKNLIVTAFEADQGEVDTFLGMEPIYTDSFDGTRRIDYGAKFNSVAVIKISVMKADTADFSVAEVRDFLRWTTGVRQNSYLDLVLNNEIKFSFLGRVTNAYQQKLDARTIGLAIEFTSVSPWAYSPIQTQDHAMEQPLGVDELGILYNIDNPNAFSVDTNGILSNDSLLQITSAGVVYVDDDATTNSSSGFTINNKTDDLYTPVYLQVVFTNTTSDYLRIKNITTGEETVITGLSQNEVITLSPNQFITSSIPNKLFGNTFNFVWPRLTPGINQFAIEGAGNGSLEWSYRYPIKIGDCAIDLNVPYSMGIC